MANCDDETHESVVNSNSLDDRWKSAPVRYPQELDRGVPFCTRRRRAHELHQRAESNGSRKASRVSDVSCRDTKSNDDVALIRPADTRPTLVIFPPSTTTIADFNTCPFPSRSVPRSNHGRFLCRQRCRDCEQEHTGRASTGTLVLVVLFALKRAAMRCRL